MSINNENPECNAVKHGASQYVTVDNKKLPMSNIIGHRSVPLEKGQWWNIRFFSEVEEVGEKNVIT